MVVEVEGGVDLLFTCLSVCLHLGLSGRRKAVAMQDSESEVGVVCCAVELWVMFSYLSSKHVIW